MKNKIFLLLIVMVVGLGWGSTLQAQSTTDEYMLPDDLAMPVVTSTSVPDQVFRAKIITILEEGEKELDPGTKQPYQKLEVEILNGADKGKHVSVDNGGSFVIGQYQSFKKGDVVVLTKPASSPKKDFYYITDNYRINRLILITLLFFALATLFGKKRGLTAIVGLVFSVLVIFYFIVPRILHGSDPLVITLIGSVVIMIFSLYLAHGFNKRTSIALIAGIITLGLTLLLDILFVYLTYLSGSGTEEAFYLQLDNENLDLKGLFLSGILIGVLGVLDDVTTAQAATIEELHDVDPTLSFSELYRRGLSVGKEHIASLINTLVLAYVGVSFPLILLYTITKTVPTWVIINSNFIAEEIVRTVVGSSALVLAVPITTGLAAYYFRNRSDLKKEVGGGKPPRDEIIKHLWKTADNEEKKY
jgi:uncharacterized membrane protein